MINKAKIVPPEEWLKALTNSAGHPLNFIRCMYWDRDTSHQVNSLKLPHHLLIFVEKGKFQLNFEGKSETLSSNSMLWLSPDAMRTMWIPEGVVVTNYRLHFNLLDNDHPLRLKKPYLIINNCHRLQPFFQRLNHLHRFPTCYSEFSVRGTLTDLLASCFELSDRQMDRKNSKGLNSLQCHKIEEYLQYYLDKPIQPIDLANAVELTPDYFTRLFRNTYGVAPRTYIKQQRLQQAAVLLKESTLKISEIADQCGCHNTHLFNRQFKDFFLCTPSEYRNRTEY